MNLLLTHEAPTSIELMTGCGFAGIAMDKPNKNEKNEMKEKKMHVYDLF